MKIAAKRVATFGLSTTANGRKGVAVKLSRPIRFHAAAYILLLILSGACSGRSADKPVEDADLLRLLPPGSPDLHYHFAGYQDRAVFFPVFGAGQTTVLRDDGSIELGALLQEISALRDVESAALLVTGEGVSEAFEVPLTPREMPALTLFPDPENRPRSRVDVLAGAPLATVAGPASDLWSFNTDVEENWALTGQPVLGRSGPRLAIQAAAAGVLRISNEVPTERLRSASGAFHASVQAQCPDNAVVRLRLFQTISGKQRVIAESDSTSKSSESYTLSVDSPLERIDRTVPLTFELSIRTEGAAKLSLSDARLHTLGDKINSVTVRLRPVYPRVFETPRVRLRPNARLHFGLAVADHLGRYPRAKVRFAMEVKRGDDRIPVFEATYPLDTQENVGGWDDHSVDLSDWVGEDVSILLDTAIVLEDGSTAALPPDVEGHWSIPNLVGGSPPIRSAGDRPNVIVVSLDTLRADHVGSYGHDRPTTPHLDRFAESAYVFEDCVSPSSWTLPTHVSALTGLSPAVHGAGGIGKQAVSRDIPNLATILRRDGYRTVAFTEAGAVSHTFGLSHGFDLYDENVRHSLREGRNIEWTCEKARAWLDVFGSEPFFMFLHTYEVHSPYAPPEPFLSQFRKGPNDRVGFIPMAFSPRQAEENRSLYEGDIAYTDHVLGQFLNYVEKSGRFEDTLIIILSDHGEEFWDHGDISHHNTLYREMTHVPFLIRLPGQSAGQRVPYPIALEDTFATVLDVLGIEYSGPTLSRSVLTLLNPDANASQNARTRPFTGVVYSSRYSNQVISLRVDDWKYILSLSMADAPGAIRAKAEAMPAHSNLVITGAMLALPLSEMSVSNANQSFGVRQELYRIDRDPSEQENLAEQEPEKLREMLVTLRDQWRSYQSLVEAFGTDQPHNATPSESQIEQLRALGYVQ